MRPLAPLALLLALVGAGSGCIHVYQPLSGLHRPVVVDTQAANFTDVHLRVVCTPGEFVSKGEARELCEHVGKLFENQGAIVSLDSEGESESGFGGGSEMDQIMADLKAAEPRTDLVLELSASQLHYTNDALSWILCIGTATLVPGVTESTFQQDVVVRDGTGFLLARDRLEGRIIRTFGIGTWAGNRLMDLVRKKENRLAKGAIVHADVSRDLYGQLSQIVFNASMRWKVLQEATPDGRATAPKSPP